MEPLLRIFVPFLQSGISVCVETSVCVSHWGLRHRCLLWGSSPWELVCTTLFVLLVGLLSFVGRTTRFLVVLVRAEPSGLVRKFFLPSWESRFVPPPPPALHSFPTLETTPGPGQSRGCWKDNGTSTDVPTPRRLSLSTLNTTFYRGPCPR